MKRKPNSNEGERRWVVRLFSNSLWDYYGEPEYFDTRKAAEEWVHNRRRELAERDLEAQIEGESIQERAR